MMERIARIAFVALAVCLIARVGAGQTSSQGSIRGYVSDELKAMLPGATVSATSETVAGQFVAVSDATGYYRLLDLPPGTYTVIIEMQGFAKYVRENVMVRAGLNLSMDVQMKVGGASETIDVRAETPLLEATSPVQAMNVSGEFQRSLPLSTRKTWFDFLSMAPGAVSNDNTTSASYYVNGADFGSHVIQLDGADIAAGAQSSTLYIQMSSDVLADVQVKTGGVDASAPLGQGAVINMVSQSGTNQLRASGNIIYQDKKWSSNNNPGGTTSAFSLVQPDFSAGGPVVRDRSWVFGNYRRSAFEQGISRTPLQLSLAQALAPGFEPFDSPTDSDQVFVKSTTQIGRAHRLEGFEQYGKDTRWVIGATDTVMSRRSQLGGHAASVRLSSVWGQSTTSRIGVAYSNQSNPDTLIITDRPGRPVHLSTFLSAGRLTGTGAQTVIDNYSAGLNQDAPSEKLTFTADVTFFKTGWLGSHELQAGTYLQPRRLYQFDIHYANNGFATEDVVLRDVANPAAGFIPFHRRVYDSTFLPSTSVNSSDYAFYLQDAWRPSSRLTISAGLRVDAITRRDKRFDDIVQDTTAIGPRVGVNYVLTEDSRNIVRATYARLHDALSNGAGITAGSSSGGYVDYYDNDLNGTFESVFATPLLTQRTLNRVIDLDGYKQPHADEFTAGYRRQLAGAISVDASYVRRDFRNRATVVDINPIYENGVFLGYRDPAFNEVFRLTSNTWNRPVYQALEFTVARQAARMQVMASYTRQFRKIVGTWQPNDPASFIQPEAFANDRGIGDIRSSTSSVLDSLSGTNMANSGQWRDHVGRVAISYQAPWQIMVAGVYMYQSGVWSGPVVTRLSGPDLRFGPPTVTLSNGRVVSNPLATTIRFAFPTRGDGQFQSDAVHALNLRVGRAFAAGALRLEPALDLMNVTNHDAFQSLMSGSNQLYSPNYALGQSRQPPRSAQLSLRVVF